MILRENERLDEVNDSLKLIQKTDGLTFGTDALLLAAYIDGKYVRGVEFGGGSGIISMLLLTREKLAAADCVEVQYEYCELIERNARLNGLAERLIVKNADVRLYTPHTEYEIVYTNPPYMKINSGRNNEKEKKAIARHEFKGGIGDFLRAAKSLLKFGGNFYAVYRPDRLTDLIVAMRENGIEPKRLTFVYADTNLPPSMLLVEGKRGGKSGMICTRPLIIYSDKEHKSYTGDMKYIMEHGSFPEKFKKR